MRNPSMSSNNENKYISELYLFLSLLLSYIRKDEPRNILGSSPEARSSFARRRKEWKAKNCFSLSDLR